jgi:phage host-nuclease inhibitor protein Gam
MERNMRELVERERRLDGGILREERRWLEVLADADAKRARFQHAYAEGAMPLEDLKTRTSEVDDACRLARAELTQAKTRQERLRALEADADAVVSLYSAMVPQSLEAMTPEERHRLY